MKANNGNTEYPHLGDADCSHCLHLANNYPPQKLRLEFLSLDYTTAIKGIAMLIIMLGHCSGHYVGGRLLTPCGGIGVSLFLIASGYGLNESFLKHGLADF